MKQSTELCRLQVPKTVTNGVSLPCALFTQTNSRRSSKSAKNTSRLAALASSPGSTRASLVCSRRLRLRKETSCSRCARSTKRSGLLICCAETRGTRPELFPCQTVLRKCLLTPKSASKSRTICSLSRKPSCLMLVTKNKSKSNSKSKSSAIESPECRKSRNDATSV